MATYHYQNGDRPLDGFTIQYALGRGGFGEVYFAVSDSGREVALKAVQNFEEVELRGIGHCMNLKSPHLVMIFDIKHAADGTPWVIMEYVSGPSLREVLDESPNGLGVDQTKFFLKELARGLSYLHEAGVVHRDLKPHNVFFEDGLVKIGDYSLSKVITASHRSGNTMTVGSVHYMAPEISLGRYDKTVDIYALGVILFEMLTGKPPYIGESLGEVLMKHLSSDPDVSELPEPFAAAVVKAMQRDPADRFQTAQEMVEAIVGKESPAPMMDSFNPATLSLVGERARAAKQHATAASSRNDFGAAAEVSFESPYADIGAGSENHSHSTDVAAPLSHSTAPTVMQETSEYHEATQQAGRDRTAKLLHRACLYYAPPLRLHAEPDPLPLGLRFLTAVVVTTVLVTVGMRMRDYGAPQPVFVGAAAIPTLLISSLVTVVSIFTLPREGGIGWAVLSRVGWTASLFAALTVMVANRMPQTVVWPLILSFGATTLLFDWRCLVAPHRKHRLSVVPVIAIGAVAVMVNGLLDHRSEGIPFAGAVIMAAAITVQLVAPFRKAAANAPLLQRSHLEKRRRPQKPRLLYDRKAMFMELLIAGSVVTVIGICAMSRGRGEEIACAIVAGAVGLFALRFRLQHRAWPESMLSAPPNGSGDNVSGLHADANPLSDGQKQYHRTVTSDKTSVFLEFIILAAIALLVGLIINQDDSTFAVGAGAVVIGALAIRYRWIRHRRKQEPVQRPKLSLSFDGISILLELIVSACVVVIASVLFFVRNEDEVVIIAAIASAVAVIAVRFRLSRRVKIP
ncbi:serine/threonine-protein kinase [Fuerstiella marisgermanici]|uniref:Serine/threonine-protein kinase PrkC n=1 Tax=Fuerstiella marisgermanici TaxID=1891926 RepID=A0A1P8WC94_9PLAN|nr:serine/threonine-protein kinase [Fuerstiella marisgermanici]APZ91680.1 Serine/threonine-protein kinase PrkC [Fuerstiella marisgermanici]